MNLNKFWTRILGIFGILGGITLLTGDMLFYYDSVNNNLFENILSTNSIFSLSRN